jgi:ribosomal protein L37AE/L43A
MTRNRPDVPSNSRATCSQCSRELLLRIELRIGLCTSCLLLHRPPPVEPAAPQTPPPPPSST